MLKALAILLGILCQEERPILLSNTFESETLRVQLSK